MDRSKLKGGLATRRGGKVYDQYNNMTKLCGCKMGEKCGEGCEDLNFVVKYDKVKHEPEKRESDKESGEENCQGD